MLTDDVVTCDRSATEDFPPAPIKSFQQVGGDRQVGNDQNVGEDPNVRDDPGTAEARRRLPSLWRWTLLSVMGVVACGILVAPVFLSQIAFSRSELAELASEHGLILEIKQIRVGWFSPLRLSGVRVQSEGSSEKLHIDQVSSDLTFAELLLGPDGQLGQWVIRGVGLHCDIDRRRARQELLSLLKDKDASNSLPHGRIQIQDIVISATDSKSGECWRLTRSEVEVLLEPRSVEARFSGKLAEPSGDWGTIRGKFQMAIPSPSNHPNTFDVGTLSLSLIHISEPTRPRLVSRMPSSA